MKNFYKFLKISIFSFFLNLIISLNVFAGLEGQGPLKLDPLVLDAFIKYLSPDDHNKKKGSERHGRGWIFFVEENGLEFAYTYCPQGKQCSGDLSSVKRYCQKNIKKYLKRKGKCYLFARQRTIVWDNKRIDIPPKADFDEIMEILIRNNFY